MAVEQTLILCKADAVQRGLVGEIVARFERRGFVIVGMKLIQVEEALAKRHYAEHEGKPFFKGLIEYITSCADRGHGHRGRGRGRRVPANDRGDRSTQGRARNDSRRFRADDRSTGLIHGSDSAQRRSSEVAIWFSPSEIARARRTRWTRSWHED